MTHPGEQFYPPGVHWDAPIPRGTLPGLLAQAAQITARARRSNFAIVRSPSPSSRRMVEIAAAALLARRLRQGTTFGRAVPRQHAGSSDQLLRRAEGRRPRRASVAARWRARAVAQADRLRRAGAGHQQSVGAAADGARIFRQGPARSTDRLRRRRLGRGRHAADCAARRSRASSRYADVHRWTRRQPAHGPTIVAGRHRAAAIYRRHHRPAEGRDADATAI